jgi:Zn-dependent metalloprotease
MKRTNRRFINCTLVPDYILKGIAKRGSPKDQRIAVDTLATDHMLRNFRFRLAIQRSMAGDSMLDSKVPALKRDIFDARHRYQAEGLRVIRAEGDPPNKDDAVNEAYKGLGATYKFFEKAYGRNSIDGLGMELDGVVHYGTNYDNAMWDGQRMVFGDGDGRLFKRFTLGLDVIGHELTHGVTETTAGLLYQGQSGALNESISDVFGSLIKQFQRRQTADQADWLIGAEILGPAIKGKALRSLAKPGSAYTDLYGEKDPQPASMSDYVRTTDDNGGVHINSGIPNHAFFLLATDLAGYAWDRAGRIWYETLTHPKLPAAATFRIFAAISIEVAEELFAVGSFEARALRGAWEAVGVMPAAGFDAIDDVLAA